MPVDADVVETAQNEPKLGKSGRFDTTKRVISSWGSCPFITDAGVFENDGGEWRESQLD